MPSSAALRFISATKRSSPPQWSARASAASLPEHSSRPYRSSSTVTRSPGFRYMEEPSAMCCWVTVTTSPRPPRSSTTKVVISLVVLAMSICRSGFFSYRTSPVSPSMRMAAVAEVSAAHAVGRHSSTITVTAVRIRLYTGSPSSLR